MRKTYNHVKLSDPTQVGELNYWIRLEAGLTGNTLNEEVSSGTVALTGITDNSDYSYLLDMQTNAEWSGYVGPDLSSVDFLFVATLRVADATKIQIIEISDTAGTTPSKMTMGSLSTTLNDKDGNSVSLDAASFTDNVWTKYVIVGDSTNATAWQEAAGTYIATGTPAARSSHTAAFDLGETGGTEVSFAGDVIGATGIDCAGMALFTFASGSIPSDHIVAADWMAERWIAGDKSLYPRWKYL